MDDFAGDRNTTGIYDIGSSPLVIRSDFVDDSDWLRVNRFKKFYSYSFYKYLEPGSAVVAAATTDLSLYDLDGNKVYTAPVPDLRFVSGYQHLDPTSAMFVGITSSPPAGSDEAQYKFFVQNIDITGGTHDTAEFLTPHEGFVASALERFGDKDVFLFNFVEGVTYTMNLRGAASYAQDQTTLTDPILRLFNLGGTFLAGDNNSGLRTNARLTYTAPITGQYFLHVIGNNNSAGSYILESDQFDDFLPNVSTTGAIIPNGGAVQARSDFNNDVDWFKITLDAGIEYGIHTGGRNVITLYDAQGERLEIDDVIGTQAFAANYTPLTSGDYFVGVQARYLQDYQVWVSPNDGGEFTFPSVTGEISTTSDSDSYQVELVPYARYEIDAVGIGANPIDPIVRIDDGSTNFGTEPGTFRFKAVNNRTFQVDVLGNGTNTGQYRLNITPGDFAAGDTSTGWWARFDDRSGEANIANAIEIEGDVDFHRFEFKANNWYQIGSSGLDTFQIQTPSGERHIVTATTGAVGDTGADYFYATETGVHFLIADSDGLWGDLTKGGFLFNVVEGQQRPAEGGSIRWPNPNPVLGANMNQITGYGNGATVEVFSEIDLVYDGGTVAPETFTTLTLNQFQTAVPADSNFGGYGNVFSRQLRADEFETEGANGSWSRIVFNEAPYPESIASDIHFGTLKYAFATETPAYWEGDARIDGFTALNLSEEAAFTSAFESWSLNGFDTAQFEAVPESEAAVRIFKSALDSDDLLAFPFGPEEGGDIVLNTNSPIFQSLAKGTQGYFEILRAIGTVIDLKESTEIGRDQSVMGYRTGSDVDHLPYPSTPLALDHRLARPPVQFQTQTIPSFQFYDLSGPDFYESIAPRQDPTGINASENPFSVVVDLRPGGKSYSVDGDQQPHTLINSYFHSLKDGIGADGNDVLVSGGLEFTALSGGDGNDLLVDGVNQDTLNGGAGDDYFVLKTDGSFDTIIGGPGLDVARFEGMRNLDSLHEDLVFGRGSGRLTVSLELDGSQNRNGETMSFFGMGDENRTEALTLVSPDGALVRLSLPSVYSQLADGESKRFAIAAGADEFGQLVTPI